MTICIYCAQSEEKNCVRNEADYEGECKACWDFGVWALFEDKHGDECVCCVCAYYQEMEYRKVDPDLEGLSTWLPEHVLRNFAYRVVYIVGLRLHAGENIRPGQLGMLDDES